MKKKGKEHALLVGINIDGQNASVVQAEIVGKMLQKKAKELEIPFITYAESSA